MAGGGRSPRTFGPTTCLPTKGRSPMEVMIYLKDATGKPFLLGVYRFTSEQQAVLRRDWLSYGESGKPKTGAYRCSDEDGNHRELLLNFDEDAGIT